MKAIIWTKYGSPDGLQLQEIEKPTPKDNEVLIKIHATTVTAGDCEMRSLKLAPYLALPMRAFVGLTKPTRVTILGMELAGEIEAVGKDVGLFKEGDQVFGLTGLSVGTYAEYVCLAEKPEEGALAIKPANTTYEEAAAVPVGGLESLHYLRLAKVQNGESILINGAGGTIGTYAVQLAKYYGGEVTAVDSAAKLDMLRSIGADHVIDYTQEDFTKSGRSYDVVFDVVGKSSLSGSVRSLKPNGRFLSANPSLLDRLRGRLASGKEGKRVILSYATPTTEELATLKELLEAGKIRPVIGRRFTFEQIPEAHEYVETGQKLGNVVITVQD